MGELMSELLGGNPDDLPLLRLEALGGFLDETGLLLRVKGTLKLGLQLLHLGFRAFQFGLDNLVALLLLPVVGDQTD